MQEKKTTPFRRTDSMNRVPVFFYVKWIAYKYCNHHISPLHMKIMMKIDIYKMKEKYTSRYKQIKRAYAQTEQQYIYMNCSSLNGIFLIAVFIFLHFIASVLWYVIQFSSFPLLQLFFAILLFLCERERAIFFFSSFLIISASITE